MSQDAAGMISSLGLIPLPHEGGFFKRTWTSPVSGPDGRPLGSAILFLITPAGFSALHRIRTDELWHFLCGDPAELLQLDPSSGACKETILGHLGEEGHTPAVTVPAGVWQGARLQQVGPAAVASGWALFSCSLAPAWDESEFELGERGALIRQFPSHERIIRALTRVPTEPGPS